jgi:hypothetical protein
VALQQCLAQSACKSSSRTSVIPASTCSLHMGYTAGLSREAVSNWLHRCCSLHGVKTSSVQEVFSSYLINIRFVATSQTAAMTVAVNAALVAQLAVSDVPPL